MILENSVKFLKYFSKGRELKLIGFLIMAFVAGCLEFLGVALVYPFILMVIKPETLSNASLYTKFIQCTGVQDSLINALILGGFALILFVLKNIYMILFLRVQSRFVTLWKQDIANCFMKYFLYASYKDVIKSSTSDKYYIMNQLPSSVMNMFVMRLLTLVTNMIIVSMVVFLIMLKFPLAGITTIIFAAFTLFIQNKFLKKTMITTGEKLQAVNVKINALICSNIENTKEIKIINAEDKCYTTYKVCGKDMANLGADLDFFAGIPPYIVEMLIVLSLLLLGTFIAFSNLHDRSAMVASFALVVASLFRIAPALNRIQTSIININSGRNYLKALIKFYERFGMPNFVAKNHKLFEPMTLTHKIELKNICYSYIEDKPVLKNISFEIEKGDFIGIIGLSGSGKTTLADVLMGLLPPDSGEIYIDGVKLTNENYHNFRSLIGYVPQEVRILEKSFKENIAWGEDVDKIDEERVRYAVESARLGEFVNQFEDGINAKVFIGANGASQGQKQRIALARVLYRNPEILVLDEATSSLDVKVEHEITDMLNNLKEKKTIIAIAHRLSTLKTCNKLIYIKDGNLVDIGTFAELSARYEDFNTLLKLSSIN